MKFGLFYLFSDFGNIPQDQLFHEVLEEIAYAEELGFDFVWLREHHFPIYGMLGNPMILAAAISQRTSRLLIGTARRLAARRKIEVANGLMTELHPDAGKRRGPRVRPSYFGSFVLCEPYQEQSGGQHIAG